MKEPTESNVPQIRFKGLEGEWEEKTLGDILYSHSFKPYIAQPQHAGGFPVVQQGDEPVLGLANGSPFVNYESVVLFGDHTLSLYKPRHPFFVASDGVKILDTKSGLDGDYFFALLNFRRPKSEGYKRHYSILKNVQVVIAQKGDEQTKIGGYFREVDRLIGLQQRKHDKLVTLKKAMLHAMFPQPGTTTPKIRFKGFSGEWVEKKLGDMCTICTGKKDADDGAIDGLYPFFTCAENHIYSHSFSFDAEAILIAGNANVGQTKYYKGKFEAYQRTYVLTNFLGINVSYLYTILNAKLQESLQMQVQVSAMSYIKLPMLKEFGLAVPPTIAEQQKIGTYFRTLDELISQHAIQLQKLKQLKSACLEKMFV